jgi:hypothetical protein
MEQRTVATVSWPTQILPYIEQSSATPGTPIAILLCPGRGTRSGGKNDYTGAYSASISNSAGGAGALNGGTINGLVVNATGYASILDPLGPKAVSLAVLGSTGNAGSSNTLLLAHGILAPTQYTGNPQGPNDVGWDQTQVTSSGKFPNMRWTDANSGADHGYIHDAMAVDDNHMGGPHDNGSPVLYADGTVRNYSYLYNCCNATAATSAEAADTVIWQALWAYNRLEDVPPPE